MIERYWKKGPEFDALCKELHSKGLSILYKECGQDIDILMIEDKKNDGAELPVGSSVESQSGKRDEGSDSEQDS